MMGSGKSAVATAVAERLEREMVDVDALIEAAAGKPVVAIFSEEGERGFRAREAAVIRRAAPTPGSIIACGGGAVLDPANVAALKAHGPVVWLKVSPNVAALRLGSDAGRPILQRMDGDLADRLGRLSDERSVAYQDAADHVVDADAPLDEVVAGVVAVVAADGA
jgi:shikimate kinase